MKPFNRQPTKTLTGRAGSSPADVLTVLLDVPSAEER